MSVGMYDWGSTHEISPTSTKQPASASPSRHLPAAPKHFSIFSLPWPYPSCPQAELEREFEEIKKQLEEDADREIEETKEKYEQK